MKVLLLSAYAARSHVYWQDKLQQMFQQWQWRLLSLPPRHFSWRVRGNALFWAMREREVLEEHYDLLIATSMVDLATLRGLVPALSAVPSILYFHENQFAYPQQAQQHSLVEAQITSIYSALAADRILFNSAYNLDSFLKGCAQLLDKLPDKAPREVSAMLREKADVIPVPVDDGKEGDNGAYWPAQVRAGGERPLRVLWAGRFEHDKGGERLLHLLRVLEPRGLDYELAMTGQQFRQSPAVFEQIATEFSHRLVHFGYMESNRDYFALLQGADIVLSTALHEFQGLAVMEAVARQCLPVVPDRLAYAEIYPPHCRYGSFADDPQREAESAVATLLEAAQLVGQGRVQVPGISHYTSEQLAPEYSRCFARVTGAQDSQ